MPTTQFVTDTFELLALVAALTRHNANAEYGARTSDHNKQRRELEDRLSDKQNLFFQVYNK